MNEEYSYEISNSHIYVRPMIGFDYSFYSNTCYNTKIDTNDCIYIIYNNYKLNKYNQDKHNQNILQLKNNNYTVSYKDNEVFTIFKLKIPGEYIDDYYSFLNSKFTKFSNEYKTQLRRFYSSNNTILCAVNDAISPSRNKLKEKAEEYGVNISDILEIKSLIKPEEELYDEPIYEKDGLVYETYYKLINKELTKN